MRGELHESRFPTTRDRKQLKLSFVEADGDEPLVEVDGMPPRRAVEAIQRKVA
jgi:hypothetical protein